MGFERAKDNTKARKSSQLPSDLLKEILEELEKAEPGTDGGTVDEEALWEGGVRAAPISDEETGPIQSTGAPGTAPEPRESMPTPAAAPCSRPAVLCIPAPTRARASASSHLHAWKTSLPVLEPHGTSPAPFQPPAPILVP
ncbi:anti-sigma-I factor RsgI2-like [Phaenicophaeus curvirostris]|uniref:anti-sigma-I factor RsgI2-like n=1 Tax=Phaenicophaeus curvirostris TaxID=33595 RepID=UPI0037F0DE71